MYNLLKYVEHDVTASKYKCVLFIFYRINITLVLSLMAPVCAIGENDSDPERENGETCSNTFVFVNYIQFFKRKVWIHLLIPCIVGIVSEKKNVILKKILDAIKINKKRKVYFGFKYHIKLLFSYLL